MNKINLLLTTERKEMLTVTCYILEYDILYVLIHAIGIVHSKNVVLHHPISMCTTFIYDLKLYHDLIHGGNITYSLFLGTPYSHALGLRILSKGTLILMTFYNT